MYVKKIIFGILLHVAVKMSDEIIEPYDKETNFNEKKTTCKTQNVYILLAFLLITIALLIAVTIYCYLIKYWAKQKHLLPFHFRNNELKEKVKDVDIKNRTYYFFDDAINIKNSDPNNIKIDEKSYKNILLY